MSENHQPLGSSSPAGSGLATFPDPGAFVREEEQGCCCCCCCSYWKTSEPTTELCVSASFHYVDERFCSLSAFKLSLYNHIFPLYNNIHSQTTQYTLTCIFNLFLDQRSAHLQHVLRNINSCNYSNCPESVYLYIIELKRKQSGTRHGLSPSSLLTARGGKMLTYPQDC